MIGLGGIGRKHAGIHKELESCELCAVCDIKKDRADEAAELFGVPAFYSVKEMLAAVKLDMTAVTTGGYEYGSEH